MGPFEGGSAIGRINRTVRGNLHVSRLKDALNSCTSQEDLLKCDLHPSGCFLLPRGQANAAQKHFEFWM